MTNTFKKSKKFDELIIMYKQMAENGYTRSNGEFIPPEKVYGDLEPFRHKTYLKKVFEKFNIKTVLDYGSGKGNWNNEIDGQENLKDFLKLDEIFQYEPSLNKTEKKSSDCSICFDVLEHVFISDIPYVIHDIFSFSKKLVIINVACYKASALLPNGENAHITVRPPLWWKGCIDTVSSNFPDINYSLIASTSYTKATIFEDISHKEQIKNSGFIALDK